jgi:hypothetical protein
MENGADLSQLTPTDESITLAIVCIFTNISGEITRQLAERSICKDVPVWKGMSLSLVCSCYASYLGYVEVNVENPMKTKKLKFSKKILVVSKYRIFLCDVKKTQVRAVFYVVCSSLNFSAN